jgi:pimeloyl-ACP methyl ester carboxylesterase
MSVVQGFKNDVQVDKVSLIGYSIGGRICLNVLERQPNWIAEVFLLASDGLKKDRVFRLATRNRIGNKIFNVVSEKPRSFLATVDRLHQWHLLSDTKHRFVHNIFDDAKRRKQGQQVWNATSKLIAHKPIIHYNAKKYDVPLHLVMGRHDRLFPPELGERFIRDLKNADLQVLPAGHNFTDAATMLQVADIILSYQ